MGLVGRGGVEAVFILELGTIGVVYTPIPGSASGGTRAMFM